MAGKAKETENKNANSKKAPVEAPETRVNKGQKVIKH